jgi:hypothetical protein
MLRFGGPGPLQQVRIHEIWPEGLDGFLNISILVCSEWQATLAVHIIPFLLWDAIDQSYLLQIFLNYNREALEKDNGIKHSR